MNKYIKERGGCVIDGRPNYRLTYSRDEIEHRAGTYSVTYGPLYLGEEFGVKHAQKYNYLDPCWVFEWLEYSYHPELVDSSNGHYEPIWTFTQRQNITWPALEFLMHCMTIGRSGSVLPLLESAEIKRKKIIKETVLASLGGLESPVMARALKKEAVFPPLVRLS